MQILKDDVRNSILQAALIEFKSHDYSDASMRRIAALAGVTTGNIYRYFTNKEELFEALVGPIHDKCVNYVLDIKKVVENSYSPAEATSKYLEMVENTIIRLFEESSAELTILLNRSSGSKYEQVKSDIVALIKSILERVFLTGKDPGTVLQDQDRHMIDMLAGTIMEGVCFILKNHEDGETVKLLVNEFIFIYHLGLEHWRRM